METLKAEGDLKNKLGLYTPAGEVGERKGE